MYGSVFLLKFGKQIQRQQLDLPEYAASFLNYKALKKLIKQLSATPTIAAQGGSSTLDTQAALRANKEVFFFRLEREIEKVNVFYLQKEAEFSLRLKTLLDKKRVIQARGAANSRLSASFATLVEGFQQFDNDLNKLQQFVEVNETAISKILKKWDKTSKSRTKEIYLQRAVELQPCFNRDVLRDLADRATTARLDLEAWAEGENIQYDAKPADRTIGQRVGTEDSDIDLQILQASAAGNVAALREWIARLGSAPNAGERFTRIFLATISEAPDESLHMFLDSGLVDVHAEDDINERNCLHEATIYGKDSVLDYGLSHGVDLTRLDVYGRVPLHYACLRGRLAMVEKLLASGPNTIDMKDHDNFTPLIHSIVRHRIECVRLLLANNAGIDPQSEADHIPLNLACQHESMEVAAMLLERNAKLLPDAEGLYPQHLVARSSQKPDLLLLLRQHGADLNQRDKLYQWTPLFHAASEGRVECLRALLENGADPEALDEKGLTAMYYATWEGHLECMDLLWERSSYRRAERRTSRLGAVVPPHNQMNAMEITPEEPMAAEGDGIPDLSLPPPIIPLRRYGHNFLDNKTFIAISFEPGSKAIHFFNEARYPAARLTISSKTSDLIPRNLMLPIQEDSRSVYFQVENLSTFAVDFEIFPTFGSKVIAKSVALPDLFRAIESSSGTCCLPLFDPRLRSVGQIQFNFQVIKPYQGAPLEITQFATYWKATSALDDHSGLVTGSSLSGDYLRLTVQLTRDGIPVIYPSYFISYNNLDVSLCQLRFDVLAKLGLATSLLDNNGTSSFQSDDIMQWRNRLSGSVIALRDVLLAMPAHINLNLHILYPTSSEDIGLGVYANIDINSFADRILLEVFDDARRLKASHDQSRSIAFSSFNVNVCTALNWKQPNFPVLLCNDLGTLHGTQSGNQHSTGPATSFKASFERATSIKEAARLAQMNNFMGLTCPSRILQMVPALTETLKQAGLVLVSDASTDDGGSQSQQVQGSTTAGWAMMPDGVNGIMKDNGILRFNETVDM
ncbi:phosphate system positive regulatory protein pho81 [Elasticomyces elasticus]|uniref:Phosphate system positive regulatory protein pho81 n=1 Tax=Exophiala sideris TaxID=1016849 RepID=A0ABR0JD53_9EURO|nr:phosphate system positive regulatory protein pho81 [Elasticomyces elasticus]KAK5032101.1 phosphate system positive regulatory protein pho81 [Exophiala sideris]KAK5041028.1 phosphate system positive regulatory protein pho81 [Exophiala sideris]KAK5061638.1 phosphate system positive regulatory protein pho81 [Exophiala sideris]KAK5184337.1 phosphate system positive regulatory protein pho81 [Eurotiomycetes sp. CCFEE 6388]